ncbi:hypothetical protein [Sphingobacterium populi]|nr:hypothetical protein [Sphingobacterium sp. CFCC 11742]
MSLILFAQSISVLGVYASFYANREYIAKNLCAYRNVKNSACGGECILMKKLKQAQDQQNDGLDRLPQASVYLVPSFGFTLSTPYEASTSLSKMLCCRTSTYSFAFHSRLLRPPLV